MDHKELVKIGFRWLRRRCTLCFSDGLGTYAWEIPDVIGWKGPHSILIECKTSRSDFLADKRKMHRQYSDLGLGHVRYYLCPIGVINIEDLPENWGLLWEKNGRVYIQKEPGEFYQESNLQKEVGFLVSMLRRVQVRLGKEQLNDWVRIGNMSRGNK